MQQSLHTKSLLTWDDIEFWKICVQQLKENIKWISF